MDTRALSMARSLRLSAGVGALVLFSVCGSAFAQQQGEGQLTIPFSSLSASAQQEILALQNRLNRSEPAAPVLLPVQEPASRNVAVPLPTQPLSLDGRKARFNWAIGVYR